MRILATVWVLISCGLGSGLAQTNDAGHRAVSVHLGPQDLPETSQRVAKAAGPAKDEVSRPQFLTATNALPREAGSGMAATEELSKTANPIQPATEPSGVVAPLQGSAAKKLNPDQSLRLARSKYGGIALQLRHAENPLQLINPFAPAEYGEPEADLPHDPATGRRTGLVLFSVRF
jgi:hypothetical protein